MCAGRIFDANVATHGRPVSLGNMSARRGDISTLRGDAMDLTAFFTMSYGLYVVSSEADGLKAGCIINTATQVTAEPPRMMVAVHKDNVTADVIAKAGKFAVTAIDKTADMPYIGNFGFRSSNTFDKFEKYGEERTGNGCPYSPQHICAVFSCDLIETVDVGTHYLFIGEVVEAERVSDEEPLTYSYYHSTLKGKTPPKASSYQA